LGAAGLVLGTTATGVTSVVVGGGQPAAAAITPTPSSTCALGNGVQHVIEITFDNVHFNRDNPNVLSDIEQIPALENFIESNGTLLSNNHTPLIAHTADDTITNYTGLYGDRQGNGISNDYYVYQGTPGGTVGAQQASFSYWTGAGTDSYPQQPYSATVPATGQPPATDPAPWAPFTRAGCDVGAVSTANMELENTSPDIANVFGSSSPEVMQLAADTTSFKDQETNDYLGLAIHCAQSDGFCSTAQAVKYGQSSSSNTAVADALPGEPGGYTGFQAVFGHKYLQPQLISGAATGTDGSGNLIRTVNGHSYEVANAADHLVDLNGTEIDGQYSDAPGPGFPGFGPITAAQSLAYVADMEESGVPVTYAYISDVHEVKSYDAGPCSPVSTYKGKPDVGYADGPGDPCYYQTTSAYNTAFQDFFTRLADDGITPANTEFVFAADEGDHFSGANVGRAETPTCTGTPDTTGYTCSYATGQLGEVEVDIHGLLTDQLADSTTFASQPQGAAVYTTGNQPASAIRQLERDFGTAQVSDPFDGATESTAKWEVDATGEELLHFAVADPNRVPTFTVFPKPDIYYTSGSSDSCSGFTASPNNSATACAFVNNEYAWNHGYYAPEVNNTWLGLVGPGVKIGGLDGSGPGGGPSSAGNANAGTATVSDITNPGTWADHTDIRPTLLALVGLKDDYIEDGRVLTEDLTITPGQTADPHFLPLAQCYKQLNSSVGQFGTDVIKASTANLESGSGSGDAPYQAFEASLGTLGSFRDATATTMKNELWNAEFDDTPLPASAANDLRSCDTALTAADDLVAGQPLPALPESPMSAALPATAAVTLVAGAVLLRRRRAARRHA